MDIYSSACRFPIHQADTETSRLTFLTHPILEKDTHDRLGVDTERDLGLDERRLEELGLGLFLSERSFLFPLLVLVGLFLGDLQVRSSHVSSVSLDERQGSAVAIEAEEYLGGTDVFLVLPAGSRLLGDCVHHLLRLSSLLVLHPKGLRSNTHGAGKQVFIVSGHNSRDESAARARAHLVIVGFLGRHLGLLLILAWFRLSIRGA